MRTLRSKPRGIEMIEPDRYSWTASPEAVDAAASVDAPTAPTGACKTAQTRFRTAPTAVIVVGSQYPDEPRRWARTPTSVQIGSLSDEY